MEISSVFEQDEKIKFFSKEVAPRSQSSSIDTYFDIRL
nr:hypothetical protein BN993_06733 [Virgibacillus halodenitrificans]CDQ37363.1 hypothetical protein BN993_06910 [Virgibacillus halodenitrificans]